MDLLPQNSRCQISNTDFPIDIHRSEHTKIGNVIPAHWHENFELLYFEAGQAVVNCNAKPLAVKAGDLIIINSNDLHSCDNHSVKLIYYVIEFNLSFLHSKEIDLCQTKYMIPLLQNRILFQNQPIPKSSLLTEIEKLILESTAKEIGYELSIKSCVYQILALLLRDHTKQTISPSAKKRQQENLDRFKPILNHLDTHYTEEFTLTELAAKANMSTSYFCRIFKTLTGKTPFEYITQLRLHEAARLLTEGRLNITEIALRVGFSDSNYFSRQFKKYKNHPPSQMLQ